VGTERAAWLERRFGAVIEIHPFDLHPEYPPEGIDREERLRRFPPGAQEHVRQMIVESGLPEPNPPAVIPNTMPALALTAYAGAQQGGAKPLHDLLFRRYWVDGHDVSQDGVLLGAAEQVGLDRAAAVDVLTDPYWAEVVRGETVQAQAMGAGGVPAWVIDGRVLIPGAQPHELFERVLDKLGHAPASGS
jgi:predicted DsbA family dithiol-disulfide isomerase